MHFCLLVAEYGIFYPDLPDIEIYGTTVLSLLRQNGTSSIAQASSIIQWLTRMVNYRIKHASSQMCCDVFFTDTFQGTAIALHALTQYSLIFQRKPNVSVRILFSGLDDFEYLNVSEHDQIKITEYYLQKAEDTIQLRIAGNGCVLAQVRLDEKF